MFKKGDKVRCLIDHNGQFTKGKIYIIRKDSPSTVYPELDDRGSPHNGFSGKNFELVSREPQFEVGGKAKIVKASEHLQHMGMMVGHTFDIVDGQAKGLTHRIVAWINERAWVALADSYGQPTQWVEFFEPFSFKEEDEKKKSEKICICESLVLFRKGCQCGAIEKRQWGLRA